MSIKITLAGNPNSGKSTLFNTLTGSNQYVGNWPGVTVEKKEGKYTKNKDVIITDLPGVYSLSPYTLEEVVSRDFLLNGETDVVIDVVDASNIERNLYLATQLSELGIPVVIALNMMDLVKKNGDKINVKKLSEKIGCKIVEISALKCMNIDELMKVAVDVAKNKKAYSKPINIFETELEDVITKIENEVSYLKNNQSARWHAIKLFENDEKIMQQAELSVKERTLLNDLTKAAEEKWDDDGEGIITDARYSYISKIIKNTVVKGRTGQTFSDKVDKIVTNRILALPIFVGLMFLVYYISISVVGGPVTDWTNDVFIGEMIQGNAAAFLEGLSVAPWLVSLIVDGIIGGVGAVLGFLPQIIVLFFLLSVLEDIGYMSRIAFILDRVFRRFGLSGKSFIPILIGMGCSVPGITATRTIENENDRKLTIMVASFMPCGAKTEIIALFAGSLFVGKWWLAPICYFIGILAVAVSGIILKKFAMFSGNPAPFVMELPEYHTPSGKNVAKTTWERARGFIVKAGTIILAATVVIWLLQNISINGEFHKFAEAGTDSLLSMIGKIFAPIFAPLGFGNWMATVASALGLVAKEVVVGTLGILSGVGEVGADDPNALKLAGTLFTSVSAMSFMIFNQLNVPCFAAIGAMKQEFGDNKWLLFAVTYQTLFAYCMAFMTYQFGAVLVLGQSVGIGTVAAIAVLGMFIYLLARKPKECAKNKTVKRAVTE